MRLRQELRVLGLSTMGLYAGMCPAPAHCSEFFSRSATNAYVFSRLTGSGELWCGSTNACESANVAGVPNRFGMGIASKGTFAFWKVGSSHTPVTMAPLLAPANSAMAVPASPLGVAIVPSSRVWMYSSDATALSRS
ncbi:hypothetical protein BC477_03460 [Clavibacter michiganensis subsp. michiganensis]|uniref:Uncharacterized protein n=1 Tax=Clavibacter michiganensis subsp. michiganensis TaxID=33013 RepID=A0A251XJX6_CLAMM|nr:hypothetical protein BC477_03460 [Clavibacter michiganensis subsp. michiganensis]OUE03771.1 hypothetical protein CMMCAS07_02395 [Clavibacter michiganensis subsp. michiganensis]